MSSTITVSGGKDFGDIREINGKWYIRTDSFYANAVEMEDAYDVDMRSGWYSNLKLAETPEEIQRVEEWKQEQELKAQIRSDASYQQSNTACFIPYVGQQVRYKTGAIGTIDEVKSSVQQICKQVYGRTIWIDQTYHTVKVRQSGKKSGMFIAPYHLEPVNPQEKLEEFIDLNDLNNIKGDA